MDNARLIVQVINKLSTRENVFIPAFDKKTY